jgi:spore coat polysaccharide biosynthesis protein SpsF
MRLMTESCWAVVPARMGSSRLPGKSMALLAGRPSLAHIVARLQAVPAIDGVILATSEGAADDVIQECALDAGAECFRGSEDDVLGRTAGAVRACGAADVVNATGDNPLIDPALTALCIDAYRDAAADYAHNRAAGSKLPTGVDIEVFRASALFEIERERHEERVREHVTLPFYEAGGRYATAHVPEPAELARPGLRLTLDTQEDLELIGAIYDALYPVDPLFGLERVLQFLDAHPELAEINRDVVQRVP